MSPCQATALITAGALSALAQSKLAGTPSALAGNAQRPAMMRRTSAAPAGRRSGLLVMNDEIAVLAQVLRAGRFAPAAAFPVGLDRKGVVSGKSVSVRVGLGGPRTYKKK